MQTHGYLGVFISGFFSSVALFIPSPTFIVVFLLGNTLNPVLLGIVGGLGAAVGEMIGYIVGYGAGGAISRKSKKVKKEIKRVEKWFKKYHPDVIIFIFSAAPLLPFDIVGLLCGAIKYNRWRFFAITVVGKIIKYLIIAFAGYYGMSFVLSLL